MIYVILEHKFLNFERNINRYAGNSFPSPLAKGDEFVQFENLSRNTTKLIIAPEVLFQV